MRRTLVLLGLAKGCRLMDRRGHLGYWATVRIDAVASLDQQYQP